MAKRKLTHYRQGHPDANYVRWVMSRHPGWSGPEAAEYARAGGGEAGRQAVELFRRRTAPGASTAAEVAVARQADMSEPDRRWQRVWQKCPVKSCLLSAGHSEAHRYPSKLAANERLAEELAASEADMSERTGE